jgi:hypothetical protein
MVPACPRCRLALERRESGYAVGAYMFNIIAAELAFAGLFLAMLWLLWPSPPWDALAYGSAFLMVFLPALFYPYSKTLFLGFDLLFRPAGYDPAELAGSLPSSGITDDRPAEDRGPAA